MKTLDSHFYKGRTPFDSAVICRYLKAGAKLAVDNDGKVLFGSVIIGQVKRESILITKKERVYDI